MIEFAPSHKVRQLQAMLFPVQPIPSGTLANGLQGSSQELQIPQSGRLGIFSVPLKQRDPKEAIRALLDARSVVDDVTQEIARWPIECQVISEKIRHIEYSPSAPEALYVSTGKEPQPGPICDELGTVLFRYSPSSVTNYSSSSTGQLFFHEEFVQRMQQQFSRSCVGGSTVLPLAAETLANTVSRSPSESKDIDEFHCKTGIVVLAETPCIDNANTDLHFESRFESGNLGKVVKITDTYYQLHLRRDLYTQRHTQWFYFRIKNTRSKITYRFSIVNLCKEESLYNDGLKPLLYSTEEARTKAVGWIRCGDNISYYRNNISRNEEEKEKHTLTFNVSFPHDRDTVYLAHCYPYTYSDLQEYLGKIVADPAKTRFTKLRILCRTLAGNGVYYLTITAPSYEEELRKKKGVVITARVHPGETPSSWTMKGIIDFLTGDSSQARELRERFVFKLVPMLNPDGVIVGNNRCSLSGKDLNRQYRTVMRESYPSVWHTKLMIRRLLEECGIAIYCDLHAHSRKHNIFAYGCENKRNGFYARLSEQIFPLMLHKNAASKFSFENCKFHIEKGKEGTGRVVVWSMGVLNSYTLEASMAGSRMGSRSGTHFSTHDYEQIGKAFCETLLDFSDQDLVKEGLRNKILTRLAKEGSTAEEPINVDLTDYSSDDGDSSSSSSLDEDIIHCRDYTWDVESYTQIHRRYPCVPPSSPTYFPSSPIAKTTTRRRKGNETERNYLERKKLLARRAVMDLPVTHPGSDLFEVTDSAEEGFMAEKRVMHKRRGQNDVKRGGRKLEDGAMSKQEFRNECIVLPAIVRPRSLSVGDGLTVREDSCKNKQRSSCVRLARRLRNTSPGSTNQQVQQIRLTSLRQQIWLGVPFGNEDKNVKGFNNLTVRSPISWGISDVTLPSLHANSTILLNSCLQKLESLNNVQRKNEIKKSRRRSRRKQPDVTIETVPSEPEVLPQQEATQKSNKKRKSHLKWQKAVNLNSRIKEIRGLQSSLLSIKADSLKLRDSTISAKSSVKQKKLKSREKTVAATVTTTARNNVAKLQSLVDSLCNSSSSEEAFTDSAKQKSTKPKQKKKKKQTKKIKTADGKKRAVSAGIFRNV